MNTAVIAQLLISNSVSSFHSLEAVTFASHNARLKEERGLRVFLTAVVIRELRFRETKDGGNRYLRTKSGWSIPFVPLTVFQ